MTPGDVWSYVFTIGVVFWLAPIACGIVAAVVAVGVVGPRDVDSLIVPGLAASGASLVAWFELDGWWATAAIAVAVAAVTALAQRWVLARVDPASASWPPVGAALTVLAGVLGGGFFAYAAAREFDLELIAVGACLGGAVGAAAIVRWGRSRGELG